MVVVPAATMPCEEDKTQEWTNVESSSDSFNEEEEDDNNIFHPDDEIIVDPKESMEAPIKRVSTPPKDGVIIIVGEYRNTSTNSRLAGKRYHPQNRSSHRPTIPTNNPTSVPSTPTRQTRPSTTQNLNRLRPRHRTRHLLLPLYPQFYILILLRSHLLLQIPFLRPLHVPQSNQSSLLRRVSPRNLLQRTLLAPHRQHRLLYISLAPPHHRKGTTSNAAFPRRILFESGV